MAYGLKYRNNFEGINDLTNVKYNVLLEIFQDGYVGAVTEIEELDKNPLQFRLDNSGDTHFTPIKKTSVSINIVDTGQFDYSEFYTSNAKKYKVVITSPVFNWKGYLVPQSYNSNLNYRQPFTLTASDGLHLLSSIDYVPDQSKTVTLAGFIADIENRIGLGAFDRTTTIQTEIGNVWDALVYEGMFTDLNYEEALEMVLKSIGMQLRYWKIFPVIESYNVTNSADVQIINKDISLSFLAPIKTAKVKQEITTLPNLMLNGMVDDLSDLVESNVGHVSPFYTLSKWVADPTVGGVLVNRGRTRSISDRDTSDYYTAINLHLMPVNGVKYPSWLTGNEISYFVCRPVNATALTFSIKANFGKVAYFSGRGSRSGLVNSKLYPAKYVELKYGIYDEISNKSFNYSTKSWNITGRPTQANCNKLGIPDPKDGDTTIHIETPATTGATTKVNFYLLGGSVEYVDTMPPAVAQTMVANILSIDAIEVDGASSVSDKELYNETSSVVDVAPNIDVLDYDISFGYCPSPPANTSLYYGSAFYHTNLAQIINVVVQGNTIPWLQYIYQTLLYTQNVQRKKVYTCSLLLKSVVNPIWLRTTLMGDVVMTNSLTFDWKTSQISAELTEIIPYVYSAWTITSESTIGSSDWGGSGGTSGSVGGGGGSVDLSNCVVKTGAASQDIEGDISADNMISRGSVVAGALNGILPDDLPVSSPLLYGVSKYDDVTIKINSNGQWYVATSGGTVVSFGTEVAGQSIQLIVAAITKTLSLAGHTHSQYLTAITKAMVEAVLTGIITSHQHNYLPINGGDLTGLLTILGQKVWYEGNDGAGSGLDADTLDALHGSAYMRYLGWVNNPGYNANTMAGNTTGFTYANNAPYVGPVVNIEAGGYNLEINAQYNNDGLIAYRVKNADSGTWNTWRSFYNSANANLKTVDWYAKNLHGVNGLFDGAVVAGALNGTLPDDLPVATSLLYGTIKFDPTTLALNGSNQLTVIGGSGSDVSWGTPTSQYTPLTVDAVTRNLSFDGHTHSYLPLSGGNLTGALTINGNTVWHAGNDGAGSGLDADLLRGVAPSSLAVLSATKLANTRTIWGQNFNGEGNVSGNLTDLALIKFSTAYYPETYVWSNVNGLHLNCNSSSEIGLSISSTSNVRIGTATDAGYKLDVNGTFRTTGAAYLNSTLSVTGASTFTGLLTANGGIGSTTGTFSSYLTANRFYTGYDAGLANAISCSNWFRSNGATGWLNATYSAGILSDTANIVRTYDTNKFKVYNTAIDSILTLGGVTAANVVSSGAVVAGALNGTLPDDLPVATTSLFGVIKTGLSLNNNVGVVNINGRHYTTTSTYTDASCREITAELVLGTGNMTAGTLDQIQLAFAPLTTTRGLTGNIIATATGAGMSLTIGFRKDTGSGLWYLMIYNGTAATVVRDGILISIRGQQTI